MTVLLLGFLCLILCLPGLFTAPRIIALAVLLCVIRAWILLSVQSCPSLFGLKHGWVPKICSIFFSLLVVYKFRWINAKKSGLKKPNYNHLFIPAIIALIFCALQFYDSFTNRHHYSKPLLETQLYELIIPGIEEEIFYRGILLGVLNDVFTRTIPFFGTRISWSGAVTTILFVFAHGVSFPSNLYNFSIELHFSLADTFDKLVWSIMFLWVRNITQSCYSSMLAHNLSNACLFLARACN
jgi:membrane protease YdiL (CAAX protease family)